MPELPERTKDVIPGVFSRHADAYRDRIATAIDRGEARGRTRLIELLAPRAGERVLDLGCGPGTLALPLAEAVGAGGLVLGVDLAAGMLAAFAEPAPAGLALAQMDMEALGVRDGAFDAAAAGHSLQFCPDLDRALSEVRRALRPGGRFAASLPRGQPSSPPWEILDRVFDRLLPPAPDPEDRHATRRLVRDDARLGAALIGAGFHEVAVELVEEVSTYTGPAEFVGRTLSWWPCAWRLEAAPEAAREVVRAEAVSALRDRLGEGPLTMPGASAVLSARVPPGLRRPLP